MNISLELFMARTTKGTQQKRRSKGDGSLFPNKRGGWTARYRKKGLPDKEFNAPTKGEAKALLDDWKIKVAIQDAITSNIKVQDYANKYLFQRMQHFQELLIMKSLMKLYLPQTMQYRVALIIKA